MFRRFPLLLVLLACASRDTLGLRTACQLAGIAYRR